jgi:hypothetical protein
VSCGVSANEYSCAHGAQINFGDPTPYLTYDVVTSRELAYCMYMECRPPCLPCVIALMSVFCVHLVINYSSCSSRVCQMLAAEQHLGRAGGTVRHGRRYGPPMHGTNLKSASPTPLLQPSSTGRHVGSILYGLWPLWSLPPSHMSFFLAISYVL